MQEAETLRDNFLNNPPTEADVAKFRVVEEEDKLDDARVYREIRRAADKWYNAEQNIIQAIAQNLDLPEFPDAPPAIMTVPHRVAVASTADLHFGKRVWNSKQGVVYNQEIAKTRLIKTTHALSQQMPIPDHVILCIGGDDIHIDTYGGATTRLTPQDMDGTPDEIIHNYPPVVIGWIHQWLSYTAKGNGTIDVLVTPGNHNRVLAQTTGMIVAAHFRKNKRVYVQYDPHPRKYVAVGTNLFGFAHGERGKPHDFVAHMASEVPDLWGGSAHRYYFIQHQHQVEVKDTNGVIFFRNSSLGGADRWHSNNMFDLAAIGATAYTFGNDGSFTHHFVRG